MNPPGQWPSAKKDTPNVKLPGVLAFTIPPWQSCWDCHPCTDMRKKGANNRKKLLSIIYMADFWGYNPSEQDR